MIKSKKQNQPNIMSNINNTTSSRKGRTHPEDIDFSTSEDQSNISINSLHGCKFLSGLKEKPKTLNFTNKKGENLSNKITQNSQTIGPKCTLGQILAIKRHEEDISPFLEENYPQRNEDNNSPGWTSYYNHDSAGRKTPGFSIKAYKIGTFSEEIARQEDEFWRDERGEDGREGILDKIFENNDEVSIETKKREIEEILKKQRREAESLITGVDLVKKKAPLGDIWGERPVNSILKKREFVKIEDINSKDKLNKNKNKDNKEEELNRKVRFDKIVEVKKIESFARSKKRRGTGKGN